MSITPSAKLPDTHSRGKDPSPFVTCSLPDEAIRAKAAKLEIAADIRRLSYRFISLLLGKWRCKSGFEAARPAGILGLAGPPGSGKTTLALGLADALARAGTETGLAPRVLFQLRTSQIYDERLGRSAKSLEAVLETVRFTAERSPAVLLINEVESAATSREHLSGGDPVDVANTTNTMLTGLDELAKSGRALVLWTTNFLTRVDRAFVDRTDWIISLPNPGATAAERILRLSAHAYACVCRLDPCGVSDFIETQYRCGQSAPLTGRDLERLLMVAVLLFGTQKPLTAQMLTAAAEHIVRSKANGHH